ncbi:MAG: pilus assembly protein PilM [Deltaproteobacteria bacterium]|nr:pilus assembly protein PilM [Deltaproteobacteria bacterium]
MAIKKNNQLVGVENTIQDQTEQYIPFDINDVNLDFDILKSNVLYTRLFDPLSVIDRR